MGHTKELLSAEEAERLDVDRDVLFALSHIISLFKEGDFDHRYRRAFLVVGLHADSIDRLVSRVGQSARPFRGEMMRDLQENLDLGRRMLSDQEATRGERAKW